MFTADLRIILALLFYMEIGNDDLSIFRGKNWRLFVTILY